MDSLKTKLFNHQQVAFEKLKDIRVFALFMDMGTGKTRTMLEFIEKRSREGKIKKCLWFCPTSTKASIMDDIKKHSYYTVEVIEKYINEFICVVGLESLSQSENIYAKVMRFLNENNFEDVQLVVDESHLIKNPHARRTKRIINLSSKIKYKAVMTGTPVTQGIWDLFTQMYVLSPKILGYSSFSVFANRHLKYSENYPNMIIAVKRESYITKKLAPYSYQITKKECLDLPPKTYSNRFLYFSEEQRNIYERVKYLMLEQFDIEEFNSYIIFRMFGYLHRISAGYFKHTFVFKGDESEEILDYDFKDYSRVNLLLEELEKIDLENNKVIIFHRYKSDLEMIAEKLKNYAVLNGNLTENKKQHNLNFFKNDCNILIANIASGSFGLNLQEANYIIYFNNTFDYSKRIQSEDRIYRIGQTKNCHIIDLIADRSIDEKIESNINQKSSTIRWLRTELDKVKNDKKYWKKLKKELENL
jgi:SNF2 family DNA or RNA helicase